MSQHLIKCDECNNIFELQDVQANQRQIQQPQSQQIQTPTEINANNFVTYDIFIIGLVAILVISIIVK